MVRPRKPYLCAKVHSRAHVRYGSLADMTASNPDVHSYPENGHSLAYDLSVAKPDPIPANDRRMIAGQAIYKDNCPACHTDAGTGTPHLFPALTTNAVRSDDAMTLIHITLEGSRAVSTARPADGLCNACIQLASQRSTDRVRVDVHPQYVGKFGIHRFGRHSLETTPISCRRPTMKRPSISDH
jgi:cytochrome c5